VSVNTVLGLPLITATGMILDFNDNVVQAKNLDWPPFPIDFRCATKTIPAIKDNEDPKTHYIEFEDVQQILQKTDAYIAGVCKRIQSVPASTVHPASATAPARVRFDANNHSSVSDSDTVTTSTPSTNRSIEHSWVPPPSAHDTTTEYQDQVLGEAGYL
jgi:hypothetical protein